MSNTIVVGFNGTASSSEAVTWAANEAQSRTLPLRVVACYEMPAYAGEAAVSWGAGAAYDAIRSAAQADATAVRAMVASSHPTVHCTVDIVPGSAALALLDGLEPDDLVVVGASSHEGASAFWMGTTPRHLVHDSPCPVAVVRGSASRGKPDRIVVGIDGSIAADAALLWAGDEADRHGVPLVVVHAWEYPYTPTDTASAQGRELTEIDAACTLERSVESARERCGIAVVQRLVEGSTVSALLDSVRDGDLLVVGSRGRGALRSRLFGSTANSVLDASSVPVVVVRADAGAADAAHMAAALADA